MAKNGFWPRVNRNGPVHPTLKTACWLWTGWMGEHGYGLYHVPGSRAAGVRRASTTHRYAWEQWNGPIPDGLKALHKCDVRACVNPAHLFLGTDQDNMDDMYAKGRGRKARGEEVTLAKVTEDQVREIRKRREAGELLKTIAPDYRLSLVAVSCICLRKTWKHVE